MTKHKHNTHIIQQQQLDILLDSEEEAIEFQELLASIARQKLPTILERVFNKHSIEGQTIRLDQLAIDLGNIKKSNFQYEFLPKLEQALDHLLTEKIATLKLSQTSEIIPFGNNQKEKHQSLPNNNAILSSQTQHNQLLQTFLQNGYFPWWKTQNTPFSIDTTISEILQKQPKQLKRFLDNTIIRQRLQYQLQPATLQKIIVAFPEYQNELKLTKHNKQKSTERDGLKQHRFTSSPKPKAPSHPDNYQNKRPLQILEYYFKTAQTPEGMDINRLFVQLSEAQPEDIIAIETLSKAGQLFTAHTLDQVIQHLQPDFAGYIRQWLQLLQTEYTTLTNHQLWLPVWTFLQKNNTNFAVNAFTQHYLEQVAPFTQNTSTELQKQLLKATQEQDQYFTLQMILENVQPREQSAVGREQSAVGREQLAVGSEQLAVGSEQLAVGSEQLAVGSEQLAVGSEQSAVGSEQLAVGNHQSPPDSYRDTNHLPIAIGTPITNHQSLYLQNAGIILLYPLLSHFFQTLELLENKQFKDEAAQHRAIHLIQFLANAEAQTPEYQLPLNKILCGVELTTPVPLGIDITDTEIELAQELLEVVLARWTKLSNSTIANLRGSFLIRNGKLTQTADNYHLLVERAPYDILLRYLPWSYSTIRLPWMHHTLFVDWQ